MQLPRRGRDEDYYTSGGE